MISFSFCTIIDTTSTQMRDPQPHQLMVRISLFTQDFSKNGPTLVPFKEFLSNKRKIYGANFRIKIGHDHKYT